MDVTDTDVLVVGGGPVGLTASSLLAKYRIPAITVTKHPATAHTPRAHFINQRSMEIFRDLGCEQQVHEAGTPMHEAGNSVWATTFAGVELAELHSWGTGPDRQGAYAAASPCAVSNTPQHMLEPVLLTRARELGADVRFSHELIAIEQRQDSVLATVRDRERGEENIIRARYLIGSDGGRSTVAQQSGFEYESDTGVLNWAVNVWLEADLTEYCAYRPSILYWIHKPGGGLHSSSAWICVRPWNEWVMALIYPPSHDEPVVDEATALAYAHNMIGDPDIPVRIKATSPWAVGSALASDYRNGRIFLAGDSAHRHPPPNGLGCNTGVQDAYNLCWKLQAVLTGSAGDELLDSYQAERKPIARAAIGRALSSLRNMDSLISAFGLQHDQSAEQGWARIAELRADSAQGRMRRAELRTSLQLQEGQFNAHGIEYGVRYESGAVVHGDQPPPSDSGPGHEIHYSPSTIPGAALPHAWVQGRHTSMSTLDLVEPGRFTVLTGLGGECWLQAARDISEAWGIPLTAITVDRFQEYHDTYGDWTELREVGESGCLLVRPDRYIAWRAEERPGDPAAELAAALARLLDRGDISAADLDVETRAQESEPAVLHQSAGKEA